METEPRAENLQKLVADVQRQTVRTSTQRAKQGERCTAHSARTGRH